MDLLDPVLNSPVMAAVLAAGIPMVAFDSLAPESLGILSIGNEIRQGVVDSSASTKPYLQGSWAVTALWMARLGRPLPAGIDTGIAQITRDNLDRYHTE